MANIRIDEDEKKVTFSLSVPKKVIEDYKKFCANRGEYVSPRIVKMIIEDMEKNNESEELLNEI